MVATVDSGCPVDDREFPYMIMYAPGNTMEFNESIPGSIWMQMQAFLLKTVIPGIRFEFEGNHYGAYCRALDSLLEKALESGEAVRLDGGALQLSERGADIARGFWNSSGRPVQTHVSNVKKFINDTSLDELVAYSYSTFPETAANSGILERFERTRKDAARTMFARKRVTLEKASHMAGVSLDDLIAMLKEHGIPAYTAAVADFRRSMKAMRNMRECS